MRHAIPILLSTWSHGIPANAAAWPILAAGGAALDAVEAAGRYAEDDLDNHTVGTGGSPDRSGRVSLDASIMLSPERCGAVAFVRDFANPISLARRVMETPHVLLAGTGAEAFADANGFARAELLTDSAKARHGRWLAAHSHASDAGPGANIEELRPEIADGGAEENHDTIGVLALDVNRTIAGACSTSGLAWKLPGRVGDSPIVGHGLYVHPRFGGAVATGHGELVMGVCGTFLAVEMLRRGASPLEAGVEVLKRIDESYDLSPNDQAGVIVLTHSGQWCGVSLRPGFKIAARTDEREELVDAQFVLRP